MGNGKPRGLNAARKLRVHRRNKYVPLEILQMTAGYTSRNEECLRHSPELSMSNVLQRSFFYSQVHGYWTICY